MKNWKMWVKLTMGMGSVLILLALICLQGLRSLSTVNEEASALGGVFVPLQMRAVGVLSTLVSVPGTLNAYLYKGGPERWKDAESSLDGVDVALKRMTAFIEENPRIPATGGSAKTRQAFEALAGDVREIHTANEDFKLLQLQIIQLGDQIDRATGGFLTFQLNHVRAGAVENAANTASRVEVLRRVYALEEIVSGIQTRLLRALAEEDPSICADTAKGLIPVGVRKAKQLAEFVITEEGKTFGTNLAADLTAFGELHNKLMERWRQVDELYARSADSRGKAMAAANEIVESSRALQAGSMNAVQATVTRGSRQTLLAGLAALVVGLLAGIAVTRSITRPLGRAVGFARAVARGELGRRLHMGRKDEIGQLADALDSMVDSLNAKIGEAEEQSSQARAKEAEAMEAMQKAEAAGAETEAKSRALLAAADRLEEVAGIVSAASTELSARIEQSGHGAAEQAARMTETATAMEEMNSTVLEVARNAGSASDASASTRRKAEGGASVVQQAVSSIRKVREESLVLKQDMAALSENAQAITRIMAVISDIADQTNLLALNAAIEAARAGEAGRGFAVVADEVRNLAEKTMASTTDVGNAIKAIQDSAIKSMNQVDRAVEGIEEATDLANRSGEALQEIVGMVDQTADQVRAIAAASEEQSAASEEITHSIGQVNAIAGQTAEAMNGAARAVAELARQAQHLTGLIDDMKGN